MNKYSWLNGTPAAWDVQRKPHLGGGGGGGGTSTTTPTIPDELKPLANLYTQQATNYAQKPFQAYTGQRFADLNQTQNQGLDMVTNRALNGSQTMNNAESGLNQMMGSGPNPYLNSMYDAAAQGMVRNFGGKVLPGVNSTFSLAGRYGSGAHQTALDNATNNLTNELGNMATNMYGNAYNADQNNRLQAIGMAPTFGNSAYQDASQLLNAGNIKQQAAQNPLDFQYQQFQQAQDYPLKQMQATGGMLGQNMGSTTTSTQNQGGK